MVRSKVLVVDDSPIQREVLRHTIDNAGHWVIVAESGFDGIATAVREQPDIIVSDVIMPEISGYHLCRFVKSDDRIKHIPVVLLTSAAVQKHDRFWGLRSGANAFIDKEQDSTRLLEVIDELLAARLAKTIDKPIGGGLQAIRTNSAQIKSDLNLLFDRLLFESTLANEIRELGRFVCDSRQLLSEFCALMNSVIDYGTMGVAMTGTPEPRLFFAVNKTVGRGALTELADALAMEAEEPRVNQTFANLLDPKAAQDGISAISPADRYQADAMDDTQRIIFRGALVFGHERLGAVAVLGRVKDVLLGTTSSTLELAIREFSPILRTTIYYEESQRLIADAAQQELAAQWKKAKIEWEQTFDAISEAITVYDPQFRIVRANHAARSLFGSDHEGRLGGCGVLGHEEDCEADSCPARATLATGESHLLETHDPRLGKHLRIRTFPRKDEHGAIIGVVHVATDITTEVEAQGEQERLQRELLVAQKLESIGSLAGGIAHDFNNVLTVILGNSESALLLLDEDDPSIPLFSEITDAGFQAARLIRQLLAFARKQSMTKRPLQLGAVVSGVTKMLGRLIGEDIQLKIHATPDLPCINADEGQIEQVILNLVVNARDALPQGGRIDISLGLTPTPDASDAPPMVEFTVSDSGCGMSPEVKERIFEPFFTTKAVARGTGLGLATVHGIVAQHNGTISVESSVNEGTTFRLLFPQADMAEDPEVTAAKRTLPAGKETLWLVDDDPGVRRFMESTLRRLGYDVLAATSGPELLQATEGLDAPHLVITDVIMPEMNGRQLVESLRLRFPRIPVLFVSGYTQDVLDRHGLNQNDYRMLSKPLSPKILAEGVRRTLDGLPLPSEY